MESETKHYANDYQTSERFFFVRWRPETFPNVNMKTLHRKTSPVFHDYPKTIPGCSDITPAGSLAVDASLTRETHLRQPGATDCYQSGRNIHDRRLVFGGKGT